MNTSAKDFEPDLPLNRPPSHKPHRTGANPLYDIAREFALPLEVVYCYAWKCKQVHVANTMAERDAARTNYWSRWATGELVKLTDSPTDIGKLASAAIRDQVRKFCELQGHIPS